MDEKPGCSKDTNNSRNGHSEKALKASFGNISIQVPGDRKCEFEPGWVKQQPTALTAGNMPSCCLHVCQLYFIWVICNGRSLPVRKCIISLGAILAILFAFMGGTISFAEARIADAGIIFEENQVTSGSVGVIVEGTTAIITSPGSYAITGTCSQGTLIVDASGQVTLILDSLNLASVDGPVIDIQNAKEVTIYLPAGTQSKLMDGKQYDGVSNGQDAAVFSKADLIIRGEGALAVYGQYADGIASRDTLLIQSGEITVHAKKHGIKGKDYLIIEGGKIDVTASGDGIKATNDSQQALGYVEINAGALIIKAGDDGISAISRIAVNGGTVWIDTANNGMKSDGELAIHAGSVYIITSDDGLVASQNPSQMKRM